MTREGQSPLLVLPIDSLLSSVKQGVCKMGRWRHQLLQGTLGDRKAHSMAEGCKYSRHATVLSQALVGAGGEAPEAFGWAFLGAHICGTVVMIVFVPEPLCRHGSWGDRGSAKVSSR